jgi:hypothetical protein
MRKDKEKMRGKVEGKRKKTNVWQSVEESRRRLREGEREIGKNVKGKRGPRKK